MPWADGQWLMADPWPMCSPSRSDVAMTGELTLMGKVLKVQLVGCVAKQKTGGEAVHQDSLGI